MNRLWELRHNIEILINSTRMRPCTRELSWQKSWLERRHTPHGTNTTKQIFHSIYTGRSCSFLTSTAITEVQMGEMSKLGWLIRWSTRDMWADSLYFLYVVFGSICKTFASFQHILWLSTYACWANYDFCALCSYDPHHMQPFRGKFPTAVKVRMTSCSLMGRYHCFGRPCIYQKEAESCNHATYM
jgi:hypothetical protein